MNVNDTVKKVVKSLAVMHVLEALLITRRVAKSRGLKPAKYVFLTLFFGFFVWVPLLRKPKVEKKGRKGQAVDI